MLKNSQALEKKTINNNLLVCDIPNLDARGAIFCRYAKGFSNSCSDGWYTGHSGISLVQCRSVLLKSKLPTLHEILCLCLEIEFLGFVFLVLPQYLATLGAPIFIMLLLLQQFLCVGNARMMKEQCFCCWFVGVPTQRTNIYYLHRNRKSSYISGREV